MRRSPADSTNRSLAAFLKVATHPCLFIPRLRTQRQFIQFRPGFTPCGTVPVKKADEPLAMGGFDQVKHLMDHYILKQILGLLHQFGVQPNGPCPVVAAAPLGLHALEEVPGHLHAQLDACAARC